MLEGFLQPKYKLRANFLEVENTSLFKDKTSSISENAWMRGYKAITNYPRRNFHLDPIREFFIKYIMTYKERFHFGEMIFAFDLDKNGYLDKEEFISAIQNAVKEYDITMAKKIYSFIDINDDGHVEFEEFI